MLQHQREAMPLLGSHSQQPPAVAAAAALTPQTYSGTLAHAHSSSVRTVYSRHCWIDLEAGELLKYPAVMLEQSLCECRGGICRFFFSYVCWCDSLGNWDSLHPLHCAPTLQVGASLDLLNWNLEANVAFKHSTCSCSVTCWSEIRSAIADFGSDGGKQALCSHRLMILLSSLHPHVSDYMMLLSERAGSSLCLHRLLLLLIIQYLCDIHIPVMCRSADVK